MSPQTYKVRLQQVFEDMLELYEAAPREANPVLGRSLLHLNRSVIALRRERFSLRQEGRFHASRSRTCVPRAIAILQKAKRPMHLSKILGLMRAEHAELWDLEYRTLHPTIRQEVRKGKRRIAEAGIRDGRTLYALPHWKSAIPYVTKPKFGPTPARKVV